MCMFAHSHPQVEWTIFIKQKAEHTVPQELIQNREPDLSSDHCDNVMVNCAVPVLWLDIPLNYVSSISSSDWGPALHFRLEISYFGITKSDLHMTSHHFEWHSGQYKMDWTAATADAIV